jgi:two-component system sensor histidine kinase RpfC
VDASTDKAPAAPGGGAAPPGAALPAALRSLRLRRHDQLGREQGQTVVRVAILAILIAYLVATHFPIDFSAGVPTWLLVVCGYFLLATAVMVLAFRDVLGARVRRTVTAIADMATISYLLIATGESGIPFFVLYLWVTLGNGFRFGTGAMLGSALLAVLGFSVVVAVSELWQGQVMLSVGVLVGLILIPGYTAHLLRQLHQARQRAEEASAAKSSFLARMSHELRTPLSGILGTTDLLAANKRVSREDRALLEIIRDSVRVSMRQIDNVLDFSKIEAGKLTIERIEFDLHELLNRSLRLVRTIAAEKHLRLTLHIDPALPYRLIGDPHHLHEVLLNLLSNAIKFTATGYVALQARLVRTLDHACLVRFEVHDTGIGIAAEAQERIFEAFGQENTATTRRYGGTGLGVTIARQLVELMGGRLGVTSAKGEGATFHAQIPLTVAAWAPEDARAVAGMRVLLVSSDGMLHDRLAARLQEWQVSLQVVASPAEAEGLLRRGIRVGNRLHALLVDSGSVVHANGIHGEDALLGKAALASTPVFFVGAPAPAPAELRRWGYAAALAPGLPRAALLNALHSCNRPETEGVIGVEPWAWGRTARQRARLLVADDNRTNLMILRKILEAADYEIDGVEDGERALEMLLQGRYKAAVLDMHMPGLDGIGVLHQYRKRARGARTPIIILTANATVDAKLDSAEAGADAYLTKPATATTIISTIERLLNDTEIHDLGRRHEPTAAEAPVLDSALMAELDRLYSSPAGIGQILDEFEAESRRVLAELAAAIAARDQRAFHDALHALKGSGANVGAMRLARTCEEIERSAPDLQHAGAQLLAQLTAALDDAARALREFTASDERPAQGGDRR